MDIIIYFGVVILSFWIGRCSALDEKEFKQSNKIKEPLYKPPESPKPRRQVGGYQPSTLSADKLKSIKSPKTGSGIK